MSPAIIGYTYEADVHCTDCALRRFGDSLDTDAQDGEGNPPSPVFSIYDLPEYMVCGDCGGELE